MAKNYLKFWGTRGSCPVSGPQYLEFGGNTTSTELVYDGTHIIFDSGTGIRPLGESLNKKKCGHIQLFLSHIHLDHISGFPFFAPLFDSQCEVTIWTPPPLGRSAEELFRSFLSPEFFPLRLEDLKAKLHFKTMSEKKPIQIGSLTLSFHRVNHPSVTYCTKIQTPHQTISYVTDNELTIPPDPSLISFLKGSNFLIHEAQYFPEEYAIKMGWGHSGVFQASSFIKEIKPDLWLVTHHDPLHTDEDIKRLAQLADKHCDIKKMWIGDGFELELK